MTRPVAALVAFLALAALLGMAGPAAAHESDARVEAEPAVVAPGGGIRIAGSGFTSGGELAVRLEGREERADVARRTVDPAGAFSVLVRVPAELPAGAYAIVARDADGDEIIGALTLDPSAGAGVSVDTLPPAVLMVLAAAVLAIGLVALGTVVRVRRRRAG